MPEGSLTVALRQAPCLPEDGRLDCETAAATAAATPQHENPAEAVAETGPPGVSRTPERQAVRVERTPPAVSLTAGRCQPAEDKVSGSE